LIELIDMVNLLVNCWNKLGFLNDCERFNYWANWWGKIFSNPMRVNLSCLMF